MVLQEVWVLSTALMGKTASKLTLPVTRKKGFLLFIPEVGWLALVGVGKWCLFLKHLKILRAASIS